MGDNLVHSHCDSLTLEFPVSEDDRIALPLSKLIPRNRLRPVLFLLQSDLGSVVWIPRGNIVDLSIFNEGHDLLTKSDRSGNISRINDRRTPERVRGQQNLS